MRAKTVNVGLVGFAFRSRYRVVFGRKRFRINVSYGATSTLSVLIPNKII